MKRFLVLLVVLSGCNDNGPTSTAGPSPPSVSVPTSAWVRIASLSADLQAAEVLLDGVTFRPVLGYPRVTGYRRVNPGSHRLRFVPTTETPIDERAVRLEVELGVAAGEAVTVVAAGLVDTRTLTLMVLRDEIATGGDSTRIRLVNAMSDFPAALDLWLNPSKPVARNVAFLEDRGYRSVPHGNHPLEIRRAGTREPILPVMSSGLAGNATYTMFAFGTLRNGDLGQVLVLDASLGSPALRR